MLTQAELADRLRNYISTTLVDASVTVHTDTPFHTLGIDSMGIIELVLFLERKCGITIPESELNPNNFKSVDTLAACAFNQQKS